LIGLVDDGLRTDRSAEVEAAAGTPPMTRSAVNVRSHFSPLVTFATPRIPMPRLTTLLAFACAARRAMIFRSFSSRARSILRATEFRR
jgi:hypothetical protein